MSKIEEALNKAKEERGSNIMPLKSSKDGDIKTSNIKGLVTAKQTNAPENVNWVASSKEIALMDEGDILEQKELSELKIIYSEMSEKLIANTYRGLRTKLIQKSQGRNVITMVTSCLPGPDSSSVAMNLATAFSFDESKTSLLVDCDLSNPKIDKLLDMEADVGLTDYLENENIDIDSILHKSGIKRLRVIPAGLSKESATEYFTSLRMRGLLSNLQSRYSDRYIFIDSAPIGDSADTRILVELCDYVILVVPYGKATKDRIQTSAEAIGTDKLLGVVFNDIPKTPGLGLFGLGS